jgi:PAS domain S-box-containing protein
MNKEHVGSLEGFSEIKALKDEISRLKKQISLKNEVFDVSPHYHFLVRFDGEIIELNNKTKELVLKLHNGICPRYLFDLNIIPSTEYHKYLEVLNSISSGNENKNFESIFLNFNDDFIPVKVDLSSLKCENEPFISIQAIEITPPKNIKRILKESEVYYQTIFEHNGTATLIVEEDSTISLANSQTELIFGYKPQEIMGKKTWTDFVLPQHQPRMIEYQKLRFNNSTSAPNQYEFQIFDKNGNKKDIFANICLIPGTKRTLASILDITEHNEALKTIKESENKYRTLAEAVEEFVFIFNCKDELEYINEYAARKFNIDPLHVIGKYRSELLNKENFKLLTRSFEKVFESGESFRIEDQIFIDESLWLDTIHIPLKNEAGGVEKVLIVARDITDRKKYELLIKRQNEILKCMGTILTKAIVSETEEELTMTALKSCEDLTQSKFGFICEMENNEKFDTLAISESILGGEKLENIDITPMLKELNIHEISKKLKKTKRSLIYNQPLNDYMENHPIIEKIMVVPLLNEGEVLGMIGLANKESDYDYADIKSIRTISTTIVETIMRKRSENRLKNALKDKEMLVKEIHHRTKNNLMIMASLLNLTSADIEDDDVREIFNQTQTRAKSMALIHEKLYQSDNYKQINFGEYIRHMTQDLFKSFLKDPDKVQLILELEELDLDINTAIPLGLILNELLTNSMKYAFPNGECGNILINFYKSDSNYVLIVADDGIGLPEDLDIDQTDTLGWQLIKSLIGQIEGDILVSREEGTMVTIVFEENHFIS